MHNQRFAVRTSQYILLQDGIKSLSLLAQYQARSGDDIGNYIVVETVAVK
jgi:hypothetical protein